MKRYFVLCDKCGREIDAGYTYTVEFEYEFISEIRPSTAATFIDTDPDIIGAKFDLCRECAKEIIDKIQIRKG